LRYSIADDARKKQPPVSEAFHLLGVGGSGMMPLALLLAEAGHRVSGADRSFDRDPADERIAALAAHGVTLLPQDAAAPPGATVVVSTAIEPDHPALAGARTVRHRSEALADLVAAAGARRRVLVAGSSGKTTTTAMVGWILDRLGLDPLVYVGGEVPGMAPRGARAGAGPLVIEVDESDGSIARFAPDVAVVTSVSADHKPLAEIERLFREVCAKTETTVLSEAAGRSLSLPGVPASPAPLSGLLGDFNRINEALAVAAAVKIGARPAAAAAALRDFPGVHRRLEIVADRDGRTVIDDFAHNPEKIEASLAAVRSLGRPVLAIFQPHGYQPTRMHKDAWGEVFTRYLPYPHALVCLPIFDAGGTVNRDITSQAIVEAARGVTARTAPREEALAQARAFLADPGVVLVMGARDPSLSAFARRIADAFIPG